MINEHVICRPSAPVGPENVLLRVMLLPWFLLFFVWVFFKKKTVKTAVPDGGRPPGALVLTKLVE